MKKILRLFIFCIIFLHLPAQALTFNVLTLPADMFSTRENYFGFVEPAEIFASDIISNLNATKGKIVSQDLYATRAKFAQNPQLKNNVEKALKNFQTSKYIDFKTYKAAGQYFDAKSVLIIRSYVTSDDNTLKRNIWDVLDITSYFNVALRTLSKHLE